VPEAVRAYFAACAGGLFKDDETQFAACEFDSGCIGGTKVIADERGDACGTDGAGGSRPP
jgi:hypothetical protein